ncbi:hypothetical protein ACOME3_002893 [Neoechinorhynchus agilis]
MANVYMNYVEQRTLDSTAQEGRPSFYTRYVDDILTIFKDKVDVINFKNKLEAMSTLKFTIGQTTTRNRRHISSTYIDYAICKLIDRIKQHRYKTSATIHKHIKDGHGGVYTSNFESEFKILCKDNEATRLRLA